MERKLGTGLSALDSEPHETPREESRSGGTLGSVRWMGLPVHIHMAKVIRQNTLLRSSWQKWLSLQEKDPKRKKREIFVEYTKQTHMMNYASVHLLTTLLPEPLLPDMCDMCF